MWLTEKPSQWDLLKWLRTIMILKSLSMIIYWYGISQIILLKQQELHTNALYFENDFIFSIQHFMFLQSWSLNERLFHGTTISAFFIIFYLFETSFHWIFMLLEWTTNCCPPASVSHLPNFYTSVLIPSISSTSSWQIDYIKLPGLLKQTF